jgi:hypothetical protein
MHRKLFRDLVSMWQNLREVLASIDTNEDTRKYGSVARQGQRQKALDSWRGTALGRIKEFREIEGPKLSTERRQKETGALAYIANGGPMTQPQSPMEGVLRDLARQLAVSNQIAFTGLQSTDALTRRLALYEADAKSGADFHFESWAVDRLVIPAALEARAAAGDARAEIFLANVKNFGGIDQVLLGRMVNEPGAEPDATQELDKTEELIGKVEARDGSRLDEAGQWLEFVGRGLDRQEAFDQANPQKAPVPKSRNTPLAV